MVVRLFTPAAQAVRYLLQVVAEVEDPATCDVLVADLDYGLLHSVRGRIPLGQHLASGMQSLGVGL